MRRYEVRLTPSAMAQISDAVSYVRDDLGMPQAATKLLEELEEAVMGLASLPRSPRRCSGAGITHTSPLRRPGP